MNTSASMNDPQPLSSNKIILTYGFLLGLLTIVLQVISYVMDAHIDRPWWSTVILLAITIGVIVFGISVYKRENNSFLSLSQALKIGIGIALISSILITIFNFFFINYIDPNFIEKTLEFTRRQMEEAGTLTKEQIDASMEMTSRFMQPWIMNAISILGGIFWGFIISLIAGLAMRKTPNY